MKKRIGERIDSQEGHQLRRYMTFLLFTEVHYNAIRGGIPGLLLSCPAVPSLDDAAADLWIDFYNAVLHHPIHGHRQHA